ncbi:sigma 54-interacting transcriptional regulator [uncultured Lamprocystis sp.]|jgi:DNA-binding NtrC family response regulator|uniref:sigma 54-interacting transcriptional regulator n=1 Tax=uncultured Lamprocystis sp. TaxID=543132 RepID=UPI0025F87639|nr:sigma 54-interacting transcriptional regulator [uncultured Lamprocystis sp.]
MIGVSPAFQRMRNAARMVAATDVGVLLRGEPGSGRETLAREIHAFSPRGQAPFVPFHCAGAPDGGLLACIGAATTDVAQVGATLYLDEIGELTAADQARLLHVIAATDQTAAADGPRVIAASALDLHAAVADGRFRRDLYLRLSVVPIEVPPLRDRVLDIPVLTAHFMSTAAARHRLKLCRLNGGAERLFRRYLWPGNLRELANLCERLVILYPGRPVMPEDLPRELVSGEPPEPAVADFQLPPQGIDLNLLEAELIRQALALASGNKSRAARLLGLTRDTLLYRLQKHLATG